eukprot:gene13385-36520_t
MPAPRRRRHGAAAAAAAAAAAPRSAQGAWCEHFRNRDAQLSATSFSSTQRCGDQKAQGVATKRPSRCGNHKALKVWPPTTPPPTATPCSTRRPGCGASWRVTEEAGEWGAVADGCGEEAACELWLISPRVDVGAADGGAGSVALRVLGAAAGGSALELW